MEDIGSWKHTEIQMRDDKAHGFAMEITGSNYTLWQLTFNLLSSSLRFIENNKNDTNKSRQKICAFWKRFLGKVRQLKLNINSESSSLIQTHQWLLNGGALPAIKAFMFLEENKALGDLSPLCDMIKYAHYSEALTSKLVSHLYNVERQELIPFVNADSVSNNTV